MLIDTWAGRARPARDAPLQDEVCGAQDNRVRGVPERHREVGEAVAVGVGFGHLDRAGKDGA